MYARTPFLLDSDPTLPAHPATKRYVDTGGGVTDYSTISSGTINPTLAPQQSYTITVATTVTAPPTANAISGQPILVLIASSGATCLVTLSTTGTPGRMPGYPSSLQVPVGKLCVICWRYTTFPAARYTVMFFNVEQ